jgi:O-antigen ligase
MNTYINPEQIGTVLVGLYVASLSLFQLYDVHGIIRPDWAVGLAIITYSLIKFSRRGVRKLDSTSYFVLLFFTICTISSVSLLNETKDAWNKFFTMYPNLAFQVIVFLSIVNLRLSLNNIITVMNVWLILAVFISMYAIYQVPARLFGLPYDNIMYGDVLVHSLPESKAFSRMRANSIFAEPDDLGSYLVPALIWGMAMINYKIEGILPGKYRSIHILYVLIVGAGLMLTFSQASYIVIGALSVFSLFIYTQSFTYGWSLKLLIPTVIIVLTILSFVSTDYIDWFANRIYATFQLRVNSAGSLGSRINSWANIIQTWVQSPITGAGFGVYASSDVARQFNINTMFGHILASTGLMGLSVFIGVWVNNIILMYKRVIKHRYTKYSVVGLAVLFVIIGEVIRGVGSSSVLNPRVWLLLSLSSSFIYVDNRYKTHAYARSTP